MNYFIFFFIVFVLVYFTLTKRIEFFKFNKNIITAFSISLLTIALYQNISKGSLESSLQRTSLESFLKGDMEDREIFRKDVEVLVGMIIEKDNTEAGELYILARQLKNINEFELAGKVYQDIYNTYKDELDGDVMAEYAQTLFLSGGRKFNNDIDEIINSSLEKNSLNPLTLTLKGLSELEKGNPSLTIGYWQKALPLLSSKKEKDELVALIEVVKKRKNQ